jgi:hypothetical protein
MITFRYALCIALATALSPLTASQDSRSYLPSRSGTNQAPTSVSYSSASTSHTSNKRLTPFRDSLDDLDSDSGNESDNNKNSSSYIQYHSQMPVGHAANYDTSNNNNNVSLPPSYVPQRHADIPVARSYSTPSSSCEDLCEHMTPEEEDMFELLKTDLSVYTDTDLEQRSVCSLPIEEFKALAQKMASRIVCEKVEHIHSEAAGNDHDGIIGAGIKALGDHQKYSQEAAKAYKSVQDYEENHYIGIIGDEAPSKYEIKFVVAKMQADIELNVAQQFLPLSFHWNILPISHKTGFAAITALAVVGVYKLGSMLFGPSKQLAYDPSLVAAANNQSDQ